MVATVPGAPNTSMTTCFGLNGTMSFAAPLGVDVTSCEPKMPFSRYTANPATATTSTATSSIHRFNSRLPSETRCISCLSTSGDTLTDWYVPSSADINQVDSTVRDRTRQPVSQRL